MKQLAIAASALMILIGTPAFAQTTTSPAPPTSTSADNPGGSPTAGPTGTNNRDGAITPGNSSYNDSENSAMVLSQGAPSGPNSGASRFADCPQGTAANHTASIESQSQCANPNLPAGTTGTDSKPAMGH
jgi:hypothetical protein